MRREDIVIGVEYCETAPHAYGVEPRTTPYKVRFLSTNPNMREVRTYEWKRHPLLSDSQVFNWHKVSSEFLPASQAIAFDDDNARNQRVAKERIPMAERETEGKHYIKLVAPMEKGALLAERARRRNGVEEWEKDLVTPASVHRTWAEHREAQAKMEADALAAKKLRAPGALTSNIGTTVEWAQFMGMDLETLLDKVKTEYARQYRPGTFGKGALNDASDR